MSGARASLSESGFSGFHFAQLAIFDITVNPAEMNMSERLPVKDARRANPENPIIQQILILTRNLPLQAH